MSKEPCLETKRVEESLESLSIKTAQAETREKDKSSRPDQEPAPAALKPEKTVIKDEALSASSFTFSKEIKRRPKEIREIKTPPLNKHPKLSTLTTTDVNKKESLSRHKNVNGNADTSTIFSTPGVTILERVLNFLSRLLEKIKERFINSLEEKDQERPQTFVNTDKEEEEEEMKRRSVLRRSKKR
jgi:hypothetical protein